jgi:hypothetical protein
VEGRGNKKEETLVFVVGVWGDGNFLSGVLKILDERIFL